MGDVDSGDLGVLKISLSYSIPVIFFDLFGRCFWWLCLVNLAVDIGGTKSDRAPIRRGFGLEATRESGVAFGHIRRCD